MNAVTVQILVSLEPRAECLEALVVVDPASPTRYAVEEGRDALCGQLLPNELA